MRKIGILTASRTNNIGTDLQAFAMQNIFSQYADVEIIDYICERLEESHAVLPSLSLKNIYKIPYRIYKNISHYMFRKKAFKYSIGSYTHTNLSTIGDKYDAIVVGSDQVWNLNITGFDTNFFLPDDKILAKKYSYAASLGVLNVVSWEKEYNISSFLKNFTKITVREGSGVTALEQIGIPAWEILDPILVADVDLWETFSDRNIKKPYILIYQVGTSINMCTAAIEYAKINGWKIIRISEPTRLYRGVKNRSYVSMRKWINFIQNAELVITDSYHGLAFSIANNINFRLLSLSNSESNTRSMCLINKLNLSKFLYSDSEFIEIPDWNEVNKIISSLKKEAVDYIKEICE